MTHTRSLLLPSAFCLLLLAGLGDTRAYLTPEDVFPDLPVDATGNSAPTSDADSTPSALPEPLPWDIASQEPSAVPGQSDSAPSFESSTDPMPWPDTSGTETFPSETGDTRTTEPSSPAPISDDGGGAPWWEEAAAPYAPSEQSDGTMAPTVPPSSPSADMPGTDTATGDAPDGRTFYRAGSTYAPPAGDPPPSAENTASPANTPPPVETNDAASASTIDTEETLQPAAPENPMQGAGDAATPSADQANGIPLGIVAVSGVLGALVIAGGAMAFLLKRKRMSGAEVAAPQPAAMPAPPPSEPAGKRLDAALHAGDTSSDSPASAS